MTEFDNCILLASVIGSPNLLNCLHTSTLHVYKPTVQPVTSGRLFFFIFK